jgi:hypothetical protein
VSQRKTPISDLFGVPADLPERADQPQSAASSEPRNPGGAVGWVVVILLAAILAFLAFDRFGDGRKTSPDDGKNDQEQVEPKPNPSVVGKTLIFVHERNPQPIEHDLLLREMPKFCADRKLQFRALDDDDTTEPVPSIVTWAKSKGVESPFAMLTDANDKPLKVIPWPADLSKLETILK